MKTKYSDLTVNVNLFENRSHTYGFDQLEMPWQELVDLLLCGHEARDDKDGPMFNGCVFENIEQTDRIHKTEQNVTGYSLLVLDYDGNTTVSDARLRFAAVEHVGYTSFSHKQAAKDFADCFRIVVPLAQRVTKDAITSRRHAALVDWTGGTYRCHQTQRDLPIVDPSSFSHSRSFYLPAAPVVSMSNALAWHNEGELFNVEALPLDPVSPVVQAVIAPTGDVLAEVLADLRSVNLTYQEWLVAAMAICSCGGSYTDFLAATNEADSVAVRSMWKTTERKVTAGETRGLGVLINLINRGRSVKKHYGSKPMPFTSLVGKFGGAA